MDLDVRVRLRLISGDNVIFGSGICQLLKFTKEFKSLNKAAFEMSMSYRKALKIVRKFEENFGEKLLFKSIGGVGGGGSTLTEFAVAFLEKYENYESKVIKFAHDEIKKSFQDILKEN